MYSVEILKVEQNEVFTPIVTLERDNNRVILLGMLHVASKQFFKDISTRLADYENAGFQILYEEVEKIPSTDKDRLDSLLSGLEKYDLYSQLNQIILKPSWKTADLLSAEITAIDIADGMEDENMIDSEKYIRNILLPQLTNFPEEIPHQEIIIDQRNQVAVQAILSHIENSDVATFWGCSHLPGLTELLKQAGFVINKIEWVSAIDVAELQSKLN